MNDEKKNHNDGEFDDEALHAFMQSLGDDDPTDQPDDLEALVKAVLGFTNDAKVHATRIPTEHHEPVKGEDGKPARYNIVPDIEAWLDVEEADLDFIGSKLNGIMNDHDTYPVSDQKLKAIRDIDDGSLTVAQQKCLILWYGRILEMMRVKGEEAVRRGR